MAIESIPKRKTKVEEDPKTQTGGAGDGGNGKNNRYRVGAAGSDPDNSGNTDEGLKYPSQDKKEETPTGKTPITDNLNKRL